MYLSGNIREVYGDSLFAYLVDESRLIISILVIDVWQLVVIPEMVVGGSKQTLLAVRYQTQ